MAIVARKLRINGGALVNVEVNVGLVYNHYFTDLDPETEYFVEIASIDDQLEQSEWSAVVSATTNAAPEFSVILDEGETITDLDGTTIADFL